ncbi:MAG: 2,5-dioxovalerate dehydrogenase [Gammaproteobacteria bacterium RIFCSPLOWO2_02_FULL_42_14]|nr:MAG: 2,5-dioxovalerate dehydrogenase [Gammaproteobacteria bacterium RIFCSPHIGHO2_02_FULL_42_43]OGT51676.1 MAG: 2,5-dioxovalerate dehydrogenase [Gammaproteobacteria bacterium RIFCSPHIGHO2_12_FULL_41_25]OGT61574.1 MAG: 2,5-dioxovalerate dehydrogenase [Gammaproteobacteria bacterium RIFCSPLOWO2_02_FULL_42_14]OGT86197.1 MAG: 2,5-dioxovalerate dehydrogenase [Gammaproteobacteria bacterium RIFCSPLOWO2_12_FULL_42_18]
MSALNGKNFIGNERSEGNGKTFHAINPATSEALDCEFFKSSSGDIDKALTLATTAFEIYRQKSPKEISAFIRCIADEMTALGDDFITRVSDETGLPKPRIQGEKERTINQLLMFARLVEEGSWVNASIDLADPNRQPMPKPDLRRMYVPIGPVVVFGASNFPLAFSVAGGDTASAFAAGNSVIVKAHQSHPGTSEYVASAIIRAVKVCNMPNGLFSMLHEAGTETGMGLVKHPATKAVGFTGSLSGGRALFNAAASRPEPIPVYAEMGSINPVFLLPGAMAERADKIADAFHQSVTLGGGQFCTNPGMVFGLENKDLKQFLNSLEKKILETPPVTMLNSGIQKAFIQGINKLSDFSGVNKLASMQDQADNNKTQGGATIFTTNSKTLLENEAIKNEVFGACSVIVSCESKTRLEEIARNLEGQLCASVHGTEKDFEEYADLLSILRTKVGRIIINGFSTSAEVCASIVHGGPYPATTSAHMTSIGTLAIERFVRPICFQNFPQNTLPDQLKDTNPMGIWRKVNDEFMRSVIKNK